MLKLNVSRAAKENPKSVFSSSPSVSKSTAANGQNNGAQSDLGTGDSESGSTDENIILSRLRQQGIIASALPSAKATGSVSGTAKQSAVSTDASTVSLPSSSKLERFRQQVAKTLSGQTSSSASSAAAQKGSVLAPFSRTPSITAKQPAQEAAQTKSSPSSGILATTPEVEQLAELVEKLPSGFPIAEWDSMTSQQRLLAARSSGLTQQEQWQLLNASGSLSTIAAIRDIQSNYRTYGLSAQAADKLSSDLLTIDNARTSVKNREMPFATDMQRSIFLTQLDKEEQKLLDPVDRQKEGGSDTLLEEKHMLSSDEPRKTPVPKGSTEIDNSSKLASVAKDVLKGYIGIQYVLPAAASMISLEGLCKLIDHGTISIGVSGTAIWLGGASKNTGLVMDTSGDVGIITTYGVFAGSPSLSVVGFVSISNADDINDLSGQSFEAGGSGGELVTVGGEVATFALQPSGKVIVAANLNVGIGLTPPGLPAEGHAGLTTSIVEKSFNLFDAWANFIEGYNAW